mmetsp:Transcript_15838/g.40239  ORF Transcript_15838/g.40239 Transcript_15838/m.40239 type:complete len:136 (-) Transcript_15838:173-580(-)
MGATCARPTNVAVPTKKSQDAMSQRSTHCSISTVTSRPSLEVTNMDPGTPSSRWRHWVQTEKAPASSPSTPRCKLSDDYIFTKDSHHPCGGRWVPRLSDADSNPIARRRISTKRTSTEGSETTNSGRGTSIATSN